MAAAKSKPKFLVVDDVFIAQTTEGELKIPLRIKTKLMRQITAMGDDELEQLIALLEGIGDSKTAAALDELDIFDTMELVTEFFTAFTEKAKAKKGESEGSSVS